jgi:hypothetical protein
MLRPPSTAVTIGLGVAGLLVIIVAAKGLADSDLFWHLKTGELIVTTRSVPSVDPFSFTWGGQPWTPHEWLSEVLIYLSVGRIGPVAGLIGFGILAGCIVLVLAIDLGRQGARPAAIGLASLLAGWLLVPYVTVRPQVLSWLLMAILIVFLRRLSPDHPRRALWLLPLFVLWANLHGLWVVGLGAVGVYVLFSLAGRTAMSTGAARTWLLVAALGCGLAVMLTPAGPEGILYPLRYVDAGDWGLANILEWQSPDFHDPAHWGLLAMIVVLGTVGLRGAPGWMATLAWLGVVMSLVSLRNAPLLAVWGLPVIALAISARWPASETKTASASQARTRRWMEFVTALVVVIGGALVVIPRTTALNIEANVARKFPEAGLDRLLEITPNPRLLAEYGWGGYSIYRIFDSGGRVFVDGRNDMYDQSILDDYSAIRDADPGWQDLLASYQVEAMLWPPKVALTRVLAETGDWCEVYRDDHQVLYLPDCPP